jgi:transcriptional regulator with XRE-family HTH domain
MRQGDEEFALELGRRIKKARIKREMSQERLAKLATVHRGTIAFAEQGKRSIQSSTLVLIMGVLEVDPLEILGGIEWIAGPDAPSGTWSFLAPPKRSD